MGRPMGGGMAAPPQGGMQTNPGMAQGAMFNRAPSGGNFNANLQRGPMGIPGYTPGSTIGGPTPPPGGAPPITRGGGVPPGPNPASGIFRFPPPPPPGAPPGQPQVPFAGNPGGVNLLPTPNHSAHGDANQSPGGL